MAFSEIQSTLDLGHAIFASLRNLWTFNEGSGSTVADAQGGNTGTLGTGVTWSSGKLNFAGTGQVNLTTKQNLTGLANWSIAWRSMPSATSSLRMILGDNSIITDYVWFQTNTNLRVALVQQANFPLSLSRTQDRSYVLTAENIGGGFVRLRLYEDGVEVSGSPSYKDIAPSTADLSYNVIGNGYTATTFAWQGTINWLAIWDRTLSGADAALLVPNGLNAPPNSAPVASAVSISGSPTQGNVLTGSYTYSDADSDPQGVSTFRWLRNDVAIGGATSSTYTLQAADVGTTIKFEVTPVASAGTSPGSTVVSAGVGPVNALPSGTITLVNPKAYQTKQRNGSNQGTFLVSGTYTGTPTTIEYRFNGGTWATLIASPSGGAFSTSVTLTGPAQGAFEVRFGNANTITASVAFVTVCDVFAGLIDSICYGAATSLQTYTTGAIKATAYDVSAGWHEGVDPFYSINTLGSYWPHFVERYMARTGMPVCVVNMGVGGRPIRNITASNYTSIINASGVGGLAAVLSNGGANDLSFSLDQATNLANINSYANSWNSAYGCKTHLAILGKVLSPGNATTHAAFQKAELQAISSNANCMLSAILYDIDNDGIHYKTDASHQEIGRRIDAALAGNHGPAVTSVVLASSTTMIVTFDANLKTGRTHSVNCWRVFDDATQKTISSVAYGSAANKILLTVSSACSGVVTVSLGEGQSAVGVAPAGEDLVLSGQPTLNLPAQPFYRIEAITTDAVPPSLVAATISASGSSLVLTFDEPVTGTGGGVTLAASASAVSVSSPVFAANVITYALSRTVGYAESISFSYSGSGIQDLSGNSLAAITGRLIANASSSGSGASFVSASNVRQGVDRGDGVLGTLYVPSFGQVLAGVSVDNGIGTLALPTASDLRFGINRGDGVEGTLRVPTASQVLLGVLVDATLGNVRLPTASQVQSGVAFGASDSLMGSFIGSGSGSGGNGVIPTVVLSFDPITKAIGLVRNDAYLTALGTAINIPVNIPSGVDANVISGARLGAKHRHKSTTLVGNVTLEEIDSQWTAIIEFPMSATAGKDLGEYAYDVEITYSSQDITILSGSLRLIQDYSTHA